MIGIKTQSEILKMREAGQVAARVLDDVVSCVETGISAAVLNDITFDSMKKHGAVSASYHYKNGHKIFPGYACFSINDVIVHGVPSNKDILRDGDIISIDVSVFYDGFFGDNTKTVLVGDTNDEVKKLVTVTESTLQAGIDAAVPGNHIGDITNAAQCCADAHGYGIIREFVGHGVGREMHEEPQIPNYGKPNTGPLLKQGMTLAIEPMLTLGRSDISIDRNGWAVRTSDGSMVAHSEHTI
jgi:methionyl aminopeptidase